jgi:hypothetical protein
MQKKIPGFPGLWFCVYLLLIKRYSISPVGSIKVKVKIGAVRVHHLNNEERGKFWHAQQPR